MSRSRDSREGARVTAPERRDAGADVQLRRDPARAPAIDLRDTAAGVGASDAALARMDGAIVQLRRAVQTAAGRPAGGVVQRTPSPEVSSGTPGEAQAPQQDAQPASGSARRAGAGAGGGAVPPVVAGLASPVAMERFSAAAHAVANTWDLMNAEQRREELVRALKAELQAHGVPAPATRVARMDTAGVLDPGPWEIRLSANRFDEATAADVPTMATTLYHEARHAEQFHRMARLLATRGHAPADIARALAINAGVAEHAAHQPLPDGPEAAEADRWYQSLYGTGRADRERVVARMRRAGQAVSDADRAYFTGSFGATPEERQRLQDDVDAANEENAQAMGVYNRLPEEADARAVEAGLRRTHTRLGGGAP